MTARIVTDPKADANEGGKEAWLTFAEVAEILGIQPNRVKRLVEDHQLAVSTRDGKPRIHSSLIQNGEPVQHLRGTLILLCDSGYSDDEAVNWLLTPNDQCRGDAPIMALRAARKTEVRLAAQILAF